MATKPTIDINGFPLSNFITGLLPKDLFKELRRTKKKQSIVLLLVGPPASGKTTVGAQLTHQIPGSFFIDDPVTTKDIDDYLDKQHVTIIADPRLCKAEVRGKANRRLAEKGVMHGWIFFENSYEKCLANLKRRETIDSEKIISVWELQSFCKKYQIPEGVVPVPIWSEDVPKKASESVKILRASDVAIYRTLSDM
jgi:hypothetical protein